MAPKSGFVVFHRPIDQYFLTKCLFQDSALRAATSQHSLQEAVQRDGGRDRAQNPSCDGGFSGSSAFTPPSETARARARLGQLHEPRRPRECLRIPISFSQSTEWHQVERCQRDQSATLSCTHSREEGTHLLVNVFYRSQSVLLGNLRGWIFCLYLIYNEGRSLSSLIITFASKTYRALFGSFWPHDKIKTKCFHTFLLPH